MIKLVPVTISYLEFWHTEHEERNLTSVETLEKQKKIIKKGKKRIKPNSGDRIMITLADWEYFQFAEVSNPPPIERWNGMPLKSRNWLLNRIKHVDQFQLGSDDEETSSTCFFCGDKNVHVNGGGDAWWASVKKENGEMATVSYCIEHKGPDYTPVIKGAIYGGTWYEEGCYDIIGFEGHNHNMLTNPHE